MAGERGLHGDLRGFRVADFADHDHVGVLADDGAQSVGETKTDLRFDLNLIDAAQLVFDRIFDGDNFFAGIVDFFQRAVKRRRLAAARRARNENHAVGLGDHVVNFSSGAGESRECRGR